MDCALNVDLGTLEGTCVNSKLNVHQAEWQDRIAETSNRPRRLTNLSKRWIAEILAVFVVLGSLLHAQAVDETRTAPPASSARTRPQLSGATSLATTAQGHRQISVQQPVTPRTNECQLSAVSMNPVGDHGLNLQRQKEEWTLGNRLATEIERRATLISDAMIAQYVNRLQALLIRASDLQGCFVVKVIKDTEANAYSLPGGFLYVTSGLLLVADNEAELVAALAHETGHVTARHLTKIEDRRRIWGRLAFAGGPAGYLVRWRLGPLITLKLLRNAEYEADQLGLRYLNASGYDPTAYSELLQTVFQEDEDPGSFFDRLWDEHPLTRTRIERLDKALNRLSGPQRDYMVDSSEFHEVKSRLSAVIGVPNPDSPAKQTD